MYFPNKECPSVEKFTAVHNRLYETGMIELSMADTGLERTVRSVAFRRIYLTCLEKTLVKVLEKWVMC